MAQMAAQKAQKDDSHAIAKSKMTVESGEQEGAEAQKVCVG